MRPEEAAQRVLTAGLTVSASLFATGLASYLVLGPQPLPYRVLTAAATALVSTPFLTVATLVIAHAARREFYNAVVAATVLLEMLLSVALGYGH